MPAGSKLLTGGAVVQIWQLVPRPRPHGDVEEEAGEGGGPPRHVHFHLGDHPVGHDDDTLSQRITNAFQPPHPSAAVDPGSWQCVWKCK